MQDPNGPGLHPVGTEVTVPQDLSFGCQRLQLCMKYGGTKPKECIRHDIWNESPVTTLVCFCSRRMLSGGCICESSALWPTSPQVETTSQKFGNIISRPQISRPWDIPSLRCRNADCVCHRAGTWWRTVALVERNFLAVSFRERQLAVGGAYLASGCTRDSLEIPRWVEVFFFLAGRYWLWWLALFLFIWNKERDLVIHHRFGGARCISGYEWAC